MSTVTSTIAAASLAIMSTLTNPTVEPKDSVINKIEDIKNEVITTFDSTNFANGQMPFKVPAVADKNESEMPYYLKVNIAQNVINVYKKDVNGDYTIPEKVILCSTGTATPKAGSKHKLTSYRSRWNKMRGNVYAQYAVQVVGNIMIHSVPYTQKNNRTLEYWEYDKLGTKASMGCIRVSTADAKWVYENVWAGTTVEFYNDDNPGPLGKPTGLKISQDKEKRGWDPTDYVEGNPWHQ